MYSSRATAGKLTSKLANAAPGCTIYYCRMPDGEPPKETADDEPPAEVQLAAAAQQPEAVGRMGPMVLAMAGFFCMGIPIAGAHWCFSVFVLPIEREFGWTRSEVNLAYSIGIVSNGIAAPIWGRILDRYGARVTLTAGELLIAGGWLLRSQATSLAVFYASFALAYIGLPACVLSVPRTLAQAFPKRRGTIVGVATTGASVCSMILVPLSEHVIARSGWEAACFMFAGLQVAVAVLAALTFPHNPAKNTDSDGARGGAKGHGGNDGDSGLFTVTFCLFAAACNCGQLCYAAVGGSLVPYYANIGFSEKDAALLAGPLLAVPNLIGKLGFGRLSDSGKTGGPIRTFQIVFVVLTLAVVLFSLVALTSDGGDGGSMSGSMSGNMSGNITTVQLFSMSDSGGGPSVVLVAAATILFGAGYGGYISMQHTAAMDAFSIEKFGTAMGTIQGLVVIPGIGVRPED